MLPGREGARERLVHQSSNTFVQQQLIYLPLTGDIQQRTTLSIRFSFFRVL